MMVKIQSFFTKKLGLLVASLENVSFTNWQVQMSKNKGIRPWKNLEVGVLYQYVNCFSEQRMGETTTYGFVTVSMKPSSSLCEIVMNGDIEDCEEIIPGETLAFLGKRSVLPGKALTIVGDDWAQLLCFLHPKTGKVVACNIGECFFRKVEVGEG